MPKASKMEALIAREKKLKEQRDRLNRDLLRVQAAERAQDRKAYNRRLSTIATIAVEAGLLDTNLDRYPDVLRGAFLHIITLLDRTPGIRDDWAQRGVHIDEAPALAVERNGVNA